MRFLFILLTAAAAVIVRGAEEKNAPVMPSEVTLTSGRVLRNVQVIRWESGRVVLKHSGGADPIAFSLIKSISQDDLKTLQSAGAVRAQKEAEEKRAAAADEARKQELQQAAAENEKQWEEWREEASRKGTLVKGQTVEQVRRTLGDPNRRNEYAAGRDVQAIYERPDGIYYVYFTDNRVTSWQKSDRR